MNIFGTKSRTMNGHRIFLIIVGLYVTGIGAPRNKFAEVMPIMIDIIEDLDVTPIDLEPYHYITLRQDELTKFFSRESQWFSRVECLYGIDVEGSTSTSSFIEPPSKKEDILALAYITYLTFWMAVDFRICNMIFYNFKENNKEEYEPLKAMCFLYFKEMNFAFREFREQLIKSIKKEEGKRLCEKKRRNHACIKSVTKLSLDLVSDFNIFWEYAHLPDEYSQGILRWTDCTRPVVHLLFDKYYKTLFPNNDVIRSRPEDNLTIHDMHADLYSRIDGEVCQLEHNFTMNVFWYRLLRINNLQNVSRLLFKTSDCTNFNNNWQMWKYLLRKNFIVNSQNEKVQRIRKVLEIMRTIRLVNYTVLVKTMVAPLIPPPQPEQ